MNHEKIFIRDDGHRHKVCVSMWTSNYNEPVRWDFSVWECKPKKRTWINVVNTDNYDYRKLNMEERVEYEKQLSLCYVSKEEILAAKLELWNKIEPK